MILPITKGRPLAHWLRQAFRTVVLKPIGGGKIFATLKHSRRLSSSFMVLCLTGAALLTVSCEQEPIDAESPEPYTRHEEPGSSDSTSTSVVITIENGGQWDGIDNEDFLL